MQQESDYIKKMYSKPLWMKFLQHIYLSRIIKHEDLLFSSKIAKQISIDDITAWKMTILLEKLELINRQLRGRRSYIYLTKRGMNLCKILDEMDKKDLIKRRNY